MILRPCACGRTPTIAESERYRIHILSIKCTCGKPAVTLMYSKPADRDRMKQAAVDGWNLGQ